MRLKEIYIISKHRTSYDVWLFRFATYYTCSFYQCIGWWKYVEFVSIKLAVMCGYSVLPHTTHAPSTSAQAGGNMWNL